MTTFVDVHGLGMGHSREVDELAVCRHLERSLYACERRARRVLVPTTLPASGPAAQPVIVANVRPRWADEDPLGAWIVTERRDR